MVIKMIAESKSARPDLEYSASGIGINFTHVASPSIEMLRKWLNVQTALRASMVEGYRTMAADNLKLAEEALPIAFETWPQWE